MNIIGKTAIITGGAIRIGKAIAIALAKEGANIVINYNSSADAANQTAAEIEALGGKALPYKADISRRDEVDAMVETTVSTFGGIDILINNASLFKTTPFPSKDVSGWERVTGILIDGSFYCANAAAPYLLQKEEGAIINIIDLSAYEPWPNFMAHSVGKSALLAINKQLALELAPKIRVNAICPGPVLPPPNFSDEQIRKKGQKTLLERWGNAQDVSDAAVFLIKSNYITGDVIHVDGGEHLAHYKHESVQ